MWTQPVARPVVVRCDGSGPSQEAVATATRHAARHRAPLALLATRSQSPPTDPRSAGERAWWRANHTDSSVAVQILAVADLQSERVTRLAGRARVLVVSGADIAGNNEVSAGSNLFRCPVLVAGPPVKVDRRDRRAVVVGFSGSPQDADLMPAALSEAHLRGMDVVVVRAVPTQEQLQPAMDETWTALHTHCRDIPCRVVHLVGEPATALHDQSSPGDLLVVGARGASPLGVLTAASTARETARAARCDVLVLPLAREATASPAPRTPESRLQTTMTGAPA